MNPFITYRDKDAEGNLQYYILQRDFPHLIGRLSTVPIAGTWRSTVAGYNLYVIFDGTLRGNMVPGYRDISDEIQTVFDNMAAWFWAERIVPDPKRFKKFKIQSNVSTGIQ